MKIRRLKLILFAYFYQTTDKKHLKKLKSEDKKTFTK